MPLILEVEPDLGLPSSTCPSRLDVRSSRSGRHAVGERYGLSTNELEEFARHYAARLTCVARRYLRCADDADDAVQEAFMAAVKAKDRFSGRSTIYTWLYRILVNVCLMKLRAAQSGHVVSLEEFGLEYVPESQGQSTDTDMLFERPSKQLTDFRLELLRECLDTLPEDFRRIIRLRDIEQHTTTQTAVILGLTRSATKTRLCRARKALREIILQRSNSSDAIVVRAAANGTRPSSPVTHQGDLHPSIRVG